MIANSLTVLIGLWLSYRVIFSIPAGALNQIEMLSTGVAVILLALWARRTDLLGWHSGTNIVLGVGLLLLGAVQRAAGVEPLVSFWIILLIGITVAIAAMWSILYRPNAAEPAQSH
jgi:hypothetical protein